MLDYKFSKTISKEEFDNFSQNHKKGSFFQTSNWAEVKANWQPFYTGVFLKEKLVAVCLVLKRSILLGYSFMYAPRGPIMEFDNEDLLTFYLKSLKALAKDNKAISLTIDPYILRDQYLMQDEMKNKTNNNYNDEIIKEFKENDFEHTGFKKDISSTIQPRFQPSIYLDEESLALYKKSRGYKNGIKAKKASVEVKRSNKDGLDDLLDLIKKTEEAKNISLRGKPYFEKLIQAFGEDCLISIAVLDLEVEIESLKERQDDLNKRLENPTIKSGRRREYESQLKSVSKEISYLKEKKEEKGKKVNISGLLALKNKNKAELLYAGMDRDFLKYSGSNLNYVDTIDWAIENGCKVLSFGGSSGYFDEGIDRFKATFNPIVDEYIGEFIFENKKMLNYLFNKAQEIRKKLIHRQNS